MLCAHLRLALCLLLLLHLLRRLHGRQLLLGLPLRDLALLGLHGQSAQHAAGAWGGPLGADQALRELLPAEAVWVKLGSILGRAEGLQERPDEVACRAHLQAPLRQAGCRVGCLRQRSVGTRTWPDWPRVLAICAPCVAMKLNTSDSSARSLGLATVAAKHSQRLVTSAVLDTQQACPRAHPAGRGHRAWQACPRALARPVWPGGP